MSLYVRLFLSIISLFFIGYLPGHFLLQRENKFFIFFISFYIGCIISSNWLILLSLVGVKYSLQHVLLFSLGFFVCFLYLIFSKKIRYKEKVKIDRAKISKDKDYRNTLKKILFITLLILIIFNFIVVLFFTFLFPIRFWDAISCWSLKGKAFFIDRNVISFYTQHSYNFSHLSYPLYLPLMQTWIYIWLGKIDENMVKIIFPLFYMSVLFTLYYFFRQKLNKVLSTTFVFIFSSIPIVIDHGYIEYTNLLFSVILLLGVYFFYTGITSRKFYNGKLILSVIFFSILATIRSEGILYLFLFFIVYMSYHFVNLTKARGKNSGKGEENVNDVKSNIRNTNFLILAFIAIIILLPWFLLKMKLGISSLSMEYIEYIKAFKNGNYINDFFYSGPPLGIRRAVYSFISEFLFSSYDSTRAFLGSSYGPVWVILLFIFLVNIKRMFVDKSYIFLIFIIFGFTTVFLSIGIVKDFAGSVDRYILHLLPLTYFWVVSNSFI